MKTSQLHTQRERERQRDRDTERQRERDRERQRDRDRERQRQRDRDRDKETETEKDRETERDRDRQTETQNRANGQTDRLTDRSDLPQYSAFRPASFPHPSTHAPSAPVHANVPDMLHYSLTHSMGHLRAKRKSSNHR